MYKLKLIFLRVVVLQPGKEVPVDFFKEDTVGDMTREILTEKILVKRRRGKVEAKWIKDS